MRLAWAFFKRDAITALSYRISFLVQLVGNLLVLGVVYFIGKTIGSEPVAALEPYGGSFLAFLLIGIALTDCAGVSLTTFAREIREGQLTGTLEATLMSAVRLPAILVFSSLWSYFFSAIRFGMYLLVGGLLYGVSLRNANLPAAAALFILTILCFMGIGILWASVTMVVKRGEAIVTTLGYLVLLLGGVLFPSSVLPSWLQGLAELVPLKHALDGMRMSLLTGASIAELSGVMWKLAAFSAVLLPAGFGAFHLAVQAAKRNGSLTEF
jgi:ABC-2 type transport system permease protein